MSARGKWLVGIWMCVGCMGRTPLPDRDGAGMAQDSISPEMACRYQTDLAEVPEETAVWAFRLPLPSADRVSTPLLLAFEDGMLVLGRARDPRLYDQPSQNI